MKTQVAEGKKSLWLWTQILGFGCASGLPYFLIVSTVPLWLLEQGYSNADLGLFSWISLPYTLKFFFTPLVQHYVGESINKVLRLRFFAVWMQILITTLLLMLSQMSPSSGFVFLAVCGGIMLASSFQDIALEACRIEMTPIAQENRLSMANFLGFRLGTWMSSFVALMMAHFFSWSISIMIMAAMMCFNLLLTWLGEGSEALKEAERIKFSDFSAFKSSVLWPMLKKALGFLRERHLISRIFSLLFLFKLADLFMRHMWSVFFCSLHYDKSEIAAIEKFSGSFSVFLGSLMAGILPRSVSLKSAFCLWFWAQSLGCLLFFLHSLMGGGWSFSVFCVTFNQIVSGFGGTLLISYLSGLSLGPFSAIIYAFLTSASSFFRIFVTMMAGFFSQWFTWSAFFLIGFLFSVIGALWCHFFWQPLALEDSSSDPPSSGLTRSE
jgi:MFS transporter, PAT family, beta-lactamase induction signal transducer AmpG